MSCPNGIAPDSSHRSCVFSVYCILLSLQHPQIIYSSCCSEPVGSVRDSLTGLSLESAEVLWGVGQFRCQTVSLGFEYGPLLVNQIMSSAKEFLLQCSPDFRTNCGIWDLSHLLKENYKENIFYLGRPELQEWHASGSARHDEGHWPKRGQVCVKRQAWQKV